MQNRKIQNTNCYNFNIQLLLMSVMHNRPRNFKSPNVDIEIKVTKNKLLHFGSPIIGKGKCQQQAACSHNRT